MKVHVVSFLSAAYIIQVLTSLLNKPAVFIHEFCIDTSPTLFINKMFKDFLTVLGIN